MDLSTLDTDTAIAQLASGAEHRGGRAGRRADGAFFTASDVAEWMSRRAIFAIVARAADPDWDIALLATGASLEDELVQLMRSPEARARARARLTSLLVCDPTCGAGSFLVAAWHQLCAVQRIIDASEREPDAGGAAPRVRASQLYGFDCEPSAVDACRAVLAIVTGDASACIQVADATTCELPRADVLLGNPPYVRARITDAPQGLATASVGNVAAWIVERALVAAAPGAHVAFVLPISFACTAGWEPSRAHWRMTCDAQWTSHFDTIPASLFPGAVQRVSIVEATVRACGERSDGDHRSWTSRYHRWLGSERDGLLDRVRHTPTPAHTVGGSVAKIGTEVEAELLDTLFAHGPAGRWFLPRADTDADAGNVVYYKRRWSYFLLFTDHVPRMWDAAGVERAPTECKAVHIDPAIDSRILLATFSSTLFWWYFSVFTDNRNVNVRDLAAFPVPELTSEMQSRLVDLADEYLHALHASAEIRTCTYRSIGTIRNTYYRQGRTRPVVDRIDAALAEAYGMTDQQLEFVLDFERRFRSEPS